MLINNRYQVIRPLGEGGFGHAYLAEDTQMPSQRKCVIKQLKPITTSPEVYQVVQDRFQREAAILERLGENHSQIPRLYAYFTEAQKFYLVQEWIEGDTLEDITVPQDEKVVVDIVRSLLPVLDFIHQQGIIHRDLKPENIILRNGTRQPVLIDFGAVRETMGTVMSSQNHPTSSIVIGTPGYMSAEQAAGRPIPSSDLYSLGLTAIYLLTGQMPQMLSTNMQTGELVWQQAAGHVSPQLVAILDRAVQSHPRDRYTSAGEMLNALSTLPGGSTPSGAAINTNAPTVVHSNTPIQPPTPGTPESQFKTRAVAPAGQMPASTHQQTAATQAQPNASFGQQSPANNNPRPLPWFKTLTPLTAGLLAVLVGTAAIGGGLMVSRANRNTTIEPIASSRSERESREENDSDSKDNVLENLSLGDGDSTESRQDTQVQENNTAPSTNRPEPSPESSGGSSSGPRPSEFSAGQSLVLLSSSGQIDVYESPSFGSRSPSYGVDGDIVVATGDSQLGDGTPWYKVRFESGVEGWVPRSDVAKAVSTPTAVQPNTPEDLLSRAPKFTTLVGAPSERVNIRSAPSTSASSPHYGVGGDPIQVLDATTGSDGYAWYLVAFESGAEGWVRSDLVNHP
ncbi:MAG: serine/threonine protein kinase [Cyanobacteria bacterium J06560_6]